MIVKFIFHDILTALYSSKEITATGRIELPITYQTHKILMSSQDAVPKVQTKALQ